MKIIILFFLILALLAPMASLAHQDFCEGNFDCDQDIDGTDAFTLKDNFGRNPNWYFNPCTGLNQCPGDFDCDQDVDGTDVVVFISEYGRSSLADPCPVCEGYINSCIAMCQSNDDCEINSYCEKPVGQCDAQGACSVVPTGCPAIFFPICGCDGMNYGNDCEIKWEGVSIDHYGLCTQ
jgi:hypothetical protein